MFDTHQIKDAQGAPSDSHLANDLTLTGLAADAAQEIRDLFSEFSLVPMEPARPVLRSHEAYLALA